MTVRGSAPELSKVADEKVARRILKELQSLSGKRYVSPFDIASLYFALDETEEGFNWLAKAFQDRSFELISIEVDPRLQSLRGNLPS